MTEAIITSGRQDSLEAYMLEQFANAFEAPLVHNEDWYNDPVAFINDCIDFGPEEGLTTYQEEILRAITEHKRVSVRGPHGLGKTTLAALAILWFANTRDGVTDWKVVTTASAWRQLTKYLWPEVHKWARRLKWDKLGRSPYNERKELMGLSLRMSTGEAFAVASNNTDLIEGAHASSLMYVYDESKSVPNAVFDASEGAFSSGQEAFALAISTPGKPEGRFFSIQSKSPGYEDWWVRHVTLKEAIAAKRINVEWAESRRKQWGELSAIYANRVLGNFASGDEQGLIPLSWVEAANDKWRDWDEAGRPGAVISLGADIGYGSAADSRDPSVIAVVYSGNVVGEVNKYEISDQDIATMEISTFLAAKMELYGCPAYIDVIGIGAGVVHRLVERGYAAFPFHASRKTAFRDVSGELGFHNWRSAMWWLGRELLDPNNNFNVALPPDDELTGDLTAPRASITSDANVLVESKELIRRRLHGRSTNCAEAVLQALIGPILIEEQISNETADMLVFNKQIGEY